MKSKSTKKNQELRELFLKVFVTSLIKNYKTSSQLLTPLKEELELAYTTETKSPIISTEINLAEMQPSMQIQPTEQIIPIPQLKKETREQKNQPQKIMPAVTAKSILQKPLTQKSLSSQQIIQQQSIIQQTTWQPAQQITYAPAEKISLPKKQLPQTIQTTPLKPGIEKFIPSMMHQFSESPIKPPPLQIIPGQPIPRITLGKITPLLNERSISSIECPGPNKNLLVFKGGTIEATPIILTQNEIDEIMEEISAITRIPIVQGVFKAAITNLIFTAVISEFVGTRFLIEKRRPVQVPRYPQRKR